MFAAHIHQVRGSRLGEVEIHAVSEAPRKPPVSSGAAIAERRAPRRARRVVRRSARAAPPVRPVREDSAEAGPKRMGEGYRRTSGRRDALPPYPGGMKILLPDTMPLDPTLPEGWEAVVVDARAEIPAAHHDAAALVVWGSSRRHLATAAADLPQLRLVQSLAAGVEGILAAGFADDVVVATGAGLHSRTVSEHALALLLALVRRLPEAREAQERHEWSDELGGLQPLHPEGRLTTLLGARVLIWGFRSIGQTLAPMLQGLGAQVRGAARSAGTRAGVEVIAEADVPAALPGTDVLVN